MILHSQISVVTRVVTSIITHPCDTKIELSIHSNVDSSQFHSPLNIEIVKGCNQSYTQLVRI